ncbi:MAG TPA: hypothetical protein VJ486_06150 [Geothrix sp.]|nr:hypothetical protein [Geothrix sp.]
MGSGLLEALLQPFTEGGGLAAGFGLDQRGGGCVEATALQLAPGQVYKGVVVFQQVVAVDDDLSGRGRTKMDGSLVCGFCGWPVPSAFSLKPILEGGIECRLALGQEGGGEQKRQ